MTRSRFPADVLVEATTAIFEAAGIQPAPARRVAESLVDGDARGIASHGLMLVPMYVDRLRAGSVATHETADVVLDFGAIAVLDARHALGQLTSDQAMALAVDKSRVHGAGIVTVRRAFHFGGAFRYARQAASAGCVGIVASNTRPLMPAPGGATRVVGNNPIAFGIPRSDDTPILLDMALSEAALGKIRLAEAEGREIPSTWATDISGRATTDPSAAIAGMLLPIGGPKGYGLALMVDVLTGVLSGGAFGKAVQGMYADVTVPNDCAHLFIAIDVSAFDPEGTFGQSIDELVAEIRSSALAPGTERVLLPGQLEDERALETRTAGVPVDVSVIDGLREAAKVLGAQLPEELL